MIGRPTTGAIALTIALLSAACGTAPTRPTSPPTGAASATGATSATPAAPSPTPSGPTARLAVELGGEMRCSTFPQSCRATLSTLPAGATVPDDWLPPESDPWWAPASNGATTFDPTPIGSLPSLPTGDWQLLVLVLGSSDVVSFRPDGRVGEGRLGRCGLDVTVDAETRIVSVRITFRPADEASFAVACRIERR